MHVKFWGTRGSIATPGAASTKYGGNTTCLTVKKDANSAEPIIIDAGTGIRPLSEELMDTGRPISVKILFTHTHWDHIQGFPFFVPAYFPDTTIDLYSCEKLGGSLKESLMTQMDTRNFPVSYDKLQAKIRYHEFCDGDVLNGIKIRNIRLNHPGSGLGFRFEYNNHKIVFLTDHELEEEPYSGSSLKETIEFCRGADLLIHDAQYLKEEMKLYKGWGHSAVDDVFKMAVAAKVKSLVLFHHNPTRSDSEIDEILIDLNSQIKSEKLKLTCKAASEGSEIIVGE